MIYGVGGVGQAVARIAHRRQWSLVAALNRSGAKIGQDLGALSGMAAPIGVTVQESDNAHLDQIDADIAILAVHDRLADNLPIYRRLLEAGLNVICTGGETSYPAAVDPAIAAEIDAMAKANGVTLTGCGLWDIYRVWTVKALAGPCTALRGLHHRSVTDVNRFGPEVARLAKIGTDPADIGGSADGGEKSIYRVFVYQVLESLGLTVERVTERQEPVVFDETLPCPALDRDIAAGACAGMRSVIEITTREQVTARAEVDLRLTRDGEGEWMSWTIDGDPPAEMRLQGLDTGHATASSVANRILDVIAAPPGLVTVDRMAPMRPQLDCRAA
jgi:4-hydroxy-tetrahydrodipicolinate reductase